MTKVLVTGASGFIGSHLATALVARGDEVTCLVRRSSQVEPLRALKVHLAYGDVTDPDSLRGAIAGKQVVYHVAGCTKALRRAQLYQVNAQGAYNVARTCAEQATPPVQVLVSSLAAAGPALRGRPRTEADRPIQVSQYGRSKRAGERAAEAFADRVPTTIVRPPIVFGEADRDGLELFRPIARFAVHLVPGLARNRFSLVHADDLVNLLILAAQRGTRLPPQRLSENGDRHPPSCRRAEPNTQRTGASPRFRSQGYYFAACEQNPAYADLGRMIGAALGRRRVLVLLAATPVMWAAAAGTEIMARVLRRPFILNFDKVREAAAGSWVCSAQKAIDELGYSVGAPLGERLRQTAEWYRRQGWL
jgi:nucleoside-diphosphate-sugar epimerase